MCRTLGVCTSVASGTSSSASALTSPTLAGGASVGRLRSTSTASSACRGPVSCSRLSVCSLCLHQTCELLRILTGSGVRLESEITAMGFPLAWSIYFPFGLGAPEPLGPANGATLMPPILSPFGSLPGLSKKQKVRLII